MTLMTYRQTHQAIELGYSLKDCDSTTDVQVSARKKIPIEWLPNRVSRAFVQIKKGKKRGTRARNVSEGHVKIINACSHHSATKRFTSSIWGKTSYLNILERICWETTFPQCSRPENERGIFLYRILKALQLNHSIRVWL